MIEYSDDIKSQVIVYESAEYVVCHPHLLPDIINVYHLCNYKPALAKKCNVGWLGCGTWYLRNDGKYHDSSNAYGCGLGVAESIEQIVEKLKGDKRRDDKDK